MVDGALHLLGLLDMNAQLGTSSFANAFTKGIWLNRNAVAFTLSDSLLMKTRFRGGTLLHVAHASRVYAILKRSPFVSLYSTSSCHEDLAEFLTVYHLTRKLNQPFRVVITDNGKEIAAYKPMKSKWVRSRVKLLKRFYTDSLLVDSFKNAD